MPLPRVHLPFAPYRLSGVVLGCLMNHRPALEALGTAVDAPPYKAAPKAPVLYVKPRNTLAGDGATVVVPRGMPALELGASLGLVIGRTVCRIRPGVALDHVAGAVLMADISVPHASFYRPSVRLKARDGFCPIGPAAVAIADLPGGPDDQRLGVWLDGACVHQATTGERVRAAAQLVADVSAFMTLSPGDVLMLGVAHGAPLVQAGQQAVIDSPALGRLSMRFVPEGEAP